MRRTAKAVAALVGLLSVVQCHRPSVSLAVAPGVKPAAQVASNETGATNVLSGDIADREQLQDIATYLEGRVPGLTVTRSVDGDISLKIRGATSLNNGKSEPMLVVDGMPVLPGRMSFVLRGLDPHEIASIKVLRDVASTSGYGMQGAHGVILIETRR